MAIGTRVNAESSYTKVPYFLVGDPLRLNQILINLGNNAVKFTERGEIVLTTKINSISGDKITLQFSMRDTGLGMTAKQQAKLPGTKLLS